MVTFISRALLVISRFLYQAGVFLDAEIGSKYVKRTARLYDMTGERDELYYREQYLHWMMPELDAAFPERGIRILDLACGQGRFLVPLFSWNSDGLTVGVDFTKEAIEKARAKFAEARPGSLKLVVDDVVGFLRAAEKESYDAALCVEALYMIPEQAEAIDLIYRSLRPGGLAFLGIRPEYYTLEDAVRKRRFPEAWRVLEGCEGNVLGGPVSYSWYTSDAIKARMLDAGFKSVKCVGIGVLSGIGGDPNENIARPSNLGEKAAGELMGIETKAGERYPDCGRYMLVTARK